MRLMTWRALYSSPYLLLLLLAVEHLAARRRPLLHHLLHEPGRAALLTAVAGGGGTSSLRASSLGASCLPREIDTADTFDTAPGPGATGAGGAPASVLRRLAHRRPAVGSLRTSTRTEIRA